MIGMQSAAVVAELPPAQPADDHQTPAPPAAAETRSKHRIVTELKRLETETRFLEEDLEKLESTERVSVILQELLNEVERRPDPLLPITIGPANPTWDQWFEGPQNLHGSRCCIL